MELQTLRNFIEIADQGNITAAARTLGISQPALSRQLKDLEKELGVKLLVRGNRHVSLTEDGTYLLNRARELTAIAERTKNNLQGKHTLGGDLYIGAGETSAKRLMLQVSQSLRHQYPSLHVHVTYGSEDSLIANLEAGMYDFILRPGKEQPQYESLLLPVRDAWGILMTTDDPLTDNLLITPNDLTDSELIFPRATHIRNAYEHWLGQGLDPANIVGTYDLTADALGMTTVGLGRALCLEYLATQTSNTSLTFRPLAPALADPIALVWKRDRELSRIAQRFLGLVHEAVDNQKNSKLTRN
ncbi:LysR family transcriptional regulator [Lacticaseibacillus chiayiensis]|uniref:LysR family transcriptional regulator n=1 Tax=Lacticaseibacillus chiayiensis TaxID=2100821 RepID=UPI0010123A62|nr:LysR family transcriptional regulator [Lacticaseibacillus chiayiensis]RXT58986.1 LysR family transcriptional regulator [Lacticaseibacillus chiayiensis]